MSASALNCFRTVMYTWEIQIQYVVQCSCIPNACNYTVYFGIKMHMYAASLFLPRLAGEFISKSAMHIPMYCVVWWTEHTVQHRCNILSKFCNDYITKRCMQSTMIKRRNKVIKLFMFLWCSEQFRLLCTESSIFSNGHILRHATQFRKK